MKYSGLLILALLAGAPAHADVKFSFIEGAPKDRFILRSIGLCPLGPADVKIDLSTSTAGLIFDVTERGAGVQVYQPFEITSGREFVATAPVVSDGDQHVSLQLKELPVGGDVSFTIDVDDTAGATPSRISGTEIAGVEITIETPSGVSKGAFDSQGNATLRQDNCMSSIRETFVAV